jgi:CDP-glycerol glycerophosphotransferase (TagB/SpsB family)
MGQHRNNDFPYRSYVLAATSDARETFKFDNRKRFLRTVVERAKGRRIIFKLHPNERVERATREIRRHAPGALIFQDGDINPMVANCDVLITQYSSVAYVGLALGKEVYSYFDVNELQRLLPVQNGGTSARNIADVCRSVLA